jgi:competence protein ComEA
VLAYSRHQVLLVLLLAAPAGLGLAVGAWRRSHPALVDRLERIDRPVDAATSRVAAAMPAGPAGPSAPRSSPSPDHWASTTPAPSPPSTPPAEPVDLNSATAADLARLPGLSPALATRIVEARETGGPFASVEDIRRVRGIGPARLDRIRSHVTVGTEPIPVP